jgi:glycerol kinase
VVGQACFAPGMVKSTYGTGCFALLNTGETPIASNNRLLTTIAYQLGGKRTYALEGSIFVAGAVVQWLRDGLRIISSAEESNAKALAADPAQELYLVPAFVGLGAPYWNPDVRGALFGLSRGTGPNEIAKAALESVCFQTVDLLVAMRADWPGRGGRRHRAAGRWRHDRLGLDHAAYRRSDRRSRRPPRDPGDNGARRGLPGRAAGRHLPGSGALRGYMAARPALHAGPRSATRDRKIAGWRRAVQALLSTAPQGQAGA